MMTLLIPVSLLKSLLFTSKNGVISLGSNPSGGAYFKQTTNASEKQADLKINRCNVSHNIIIKTFKQIGKSKEQTRNQLTLIKLCDISVKLQISPHTNT